MGDNKVNNKLDFRNVKQTQFDGVQTNRMSFSELQSGYRSYDTTAVLKDAYTHFIQTLNSNNLPTQVTYYQATSPTQDRINVRADSGGDLAGKYITLQEYISKKTYVFWFNVSGSGTAPGIGDVEIQVDLITNDAALVVAFALKTAFNTTEEFIVLDESSMSSYVDVEYLQFGETQAINVGTSGFVVNRIVQGESFEVGEIKLEYDSNDNPIYNGNTLIGLKYNQYTASFDIDTTSSIIKDSDGDELEINADGSINTVPKKDWDNFEVVARNSDKCITQVEYNMGGTLVRTVDITYDPDGDILTYAETEA